MRHASSKSTGSADRAKMLAADLFDPANKEWDAGKRRRAFKLFLLAAAEGHASAHNSVGYFYFHGIGVARDPEKAFRWYRQAARRGDVCAYNNMAVMYRAAGNIRRTRVWFAKALAERDGDAALELAKLSLSEAKPDVEQARKYLNIVARSKYILEDSKEEARKLLGELALNRRHRAALPRRKQRK